MNWNDLNILLAVARAGSISAASRDMGVAHTTVSRQLNGIEERLGTRFFERLPGGFELTEAGEAVFKTAQKVEGDINGLMSEIKGKDHRLKGVISLTAPEGMIHRLLAPLLADFSHQHPEICIDLNVTGAALTMDRREADLALRITSEPPEACIGKQVSEFNFAVYASPEYLKTVLGRQVFEYDFVMHTLGLNRVPGSLWKKPLQPKIVMQTNSVTAKINALKSGMGAGILPCLVGNQEPGLVQVSPPIVELSSHLWLLTHVDLRKTARIKLLMAHLFEGLSRDKGLIQGTKGD